MKKVSLIIPIYNTEKYLRRCLQSALNQTYKNMEVICIDDGSTDASGKIVDEFEQNYSNIKVIHQENRGESAARNTGLQLATGDYIGFLDCDDWIELDMYEKLVMAMELKKVDLVTAGWFIERGEESILVRNRKKVSDDPFDREQFLRYLYERDSYRCFAYMWNKLYKKSILQDAAGNMMIFDESLSLGGDVLYLAKIALNTNRVCYVDIPYYHYFQRADSGCHTVKLKNRQDWLKAYEIIINEFTKKEIDEYVVKYVKRFYAYHASNVAEIALRQNNKEVFEKCKEIMLQYQSEYEETNVNEYERILRYRHILNSNIGEIKL